MGAVVSEKPELESKLRNFGMSIGTAFQLIDDALDYVADEKSLGKSVGDDFREGKVTLPIILAYEAGSSEEKNFWTRTLSDLNQCNEDLQQAISLLEKHQSIAKTISMAGEYCENARQELMAFPPSLSRTALFDLVDFCANRAY